MMTRYMRHSQKEHTCIGIHYMYISAQNGMYVLTGMLFSNFIL
jgi:hypothetical protein